MKLIYRCEPLISYVKYLSRKARLFILNFYPANSRVNQIYHAQMLDFKT